MNYFGEAWNSSIKKTYEQVPVPIGQKCSWCDELFVVNDQGFLLPQGSVLESSDKSGVFDQLLPTYAGYHKDCFLRQVFGSVGHQNKTCSCFGGEIDDPPELTKKQAATAAVLLYQQRKGFDE